MTDQKIDLGLYILDENGEPVHVRDTLEWGRWFAASAQLRVVADTKLADCHISTVFLGLDHNHARWFGGGEPILWETMIFKGPLDGECWRYTSREEALEGHQRAVRLAGGGAA